MGIYDGLKDAASVLKEAGKIEQYKQILEVQEKLLEMQKTISEIEYENKELKEKLKIKENLIFNNQAYWIIDGDKKDGPFCSCCWDDEKKTIRMQPCGNPAFFDCPKCNNKGVKIFPERDSPVGPNVFYPNFR